MSVYIMALTLLLARAGVCQQDVTPDQERMLGTWVIKSCRVGDNETKSAGGQNRMDFEGEQFFITWNGNRAAHGITFKLDPTKSPRTIELKAGEMEYSGIYEIKGDRLRICYSPKMRPTKFEPFEKEGETNVLFELERK